MKNPIRNFGALLLSILALSTHQAVAQTAVETTTATTSMGTISTFSPDTITVTGESSTSPLVYRYTKSTTYIDEAGAPVSIETVKTGVPVTVYYVKQGDAMVASKVIVRRAVSTTTAPAPVVIEKKTTTTTTTTDD